MKDKKLRSIQMRNMRDINITTFGSSITNSNPPLVPSILGAVIINNNKPFFLYNATDDGGAYIYMYAALSNSRAIVDLIARPRGEVDSVRFNFSDKT